MRTILCLSCLCFVLAKLVQKVIMYTVVCRHYFNYCITNKYHLLTVANLNMFVHQLQCHHRALGTYFNAQYRQYFNAQYQCTYFNQGILHIVAHKLKH